MLYVFHYIKELFIINFLSIFRQILNLKQKFILHGALNFLFFFKFRKIEILND